MFSIKKIVAIALVLFITACSGIKIKVAQDDGFTVPPHSSYGWDEPPLQKGKGVDSRAHLIDGYIRMEVDRALKSKELSLVKTGDKPNFLISYRLVNSVQFDQGGSISPRDDSERMLHQGLDDPNTETAFYNHAVPAQLESSGLIISLMNGLEKKTLWEAQASKLLESGQISDKKLQAIIAKVVQKSFNQFPRIQ